METTGLVNLNSVPECLSLSNRKRVKPLFSGVHYEGLRVAEWLKFAPSRILRLLYWAMNMRECRCHPKVPNATHRAWYEVGSGGVYSPGVGIDDAVRRVKIHARRDGLPSGGAIFVTCLTCGEEVDDQSECRCESSASSGGDTGKS